MRKLKVYGWTALVRERERVRLGMEPWHQQARCVVAATSLKAVGELVGHAPRQLHCLCETGNAKEIAIAMARPGVCFLTSMNGPPGDYIEVSPEAVS